MEADAEVLVRGNQGTLFKIPLNRVPATTTPRPGETSSAYRRVLSSVKLVDKATGPILALHRFKIWWIRPSFCRLIPPETILLLDQVDGDDSYRLILPVVLPRENKTSFASSSLRGAENASSLILCGDHDEAGLYVGKGHDPYALIQEGVTLATNLWNDSIPYSIDAPSIPRTGVQNVALDKLGWCSWNAFYTDVNGPKVVEALRSLKMDHKIPIRWVIIDDGWQHITNSNDHQTSNKSVNLDGFQWSQRLQSLREDPIKFQDLSLKETIHQLRNNLGIEAVWVWHTLTGYWLGVNQESPSFSGSAQLQYAHFPPGILDNDSSASVEPSIDQGVGIPKNAQSFFRQYHSVYLAGMCHVDGIKVDAQAIAGILNPTRASESAKGRRNDGWAATCPAPVIALHDALAESVFSNFVPKSHHQGADEADPEMEHHQGPPSIIHCMAHAPEIFYRLPSLYQRGGGSQASTLPFFRAADDFYPSNPNSHGPQIVACAYNSLLFQHVAKPDFDMFATGARINTATVVARCISGGPIYFSSSPADLRESERQPPEWIDWISCADGTTLPCSGTAIPVASCLLQDPLAPNAAPLVLRNTNGDGIFDERGDVFSNCTSAVLALFHLSGSGRWDNIKQGYVSSDQGWGDPSKYQKEDASVATVCPNMIPQFLGKDDGSTKLLATWFFSQSVQVMPTRNASMQVPLQGLQSEVVTLYPILQLTDKNESLSLAWEVVVLGFEGKMNAAGAVQTVNQTSNNSMNLTIRGCGTFLLLLRDASTQAGVDGGLISVIVDGITAQQTVISDLSEGFPTKRLRTEILRLGFSLLLVDIPPMDFPEKHELTVKLTARTGIDL